MSCNFFFGDLGCWIILIILLWAIFCLKGPKIVLVGLQKLCQWGSINFLYLFIVFFLEPAGAMAPFSPHVAVSAFTPTPFQRFTSNQVLRIVELGLKLQA